MPFTTKIVFVFIVGKMNILISLTISILGGLVVVSFSYKYYNKAKFFNAFNVFLQTIYANMQFFQDDIKKIINTMPQNNNTSYNTLVNSYLKFLAENDRQKLAQNISALTELSALDKEKICLFFYELGHTDNTTQLNSIQALQKHIAERIQETKQEINTKAVLIQKLGIVLGMAIFILLL